MSGASVHGGEFIQYAMRMQAAAVLTDAIGLEIAKRDVATLDIPFIIVADPRLASAQAAARYFGAQLGERTLIPGSDASLGETRFADWLE